MRAIALYGLGFAAACVLCPGAWPCEHPAVGAGGAVTRCGVPRTVMRDSLVGVGSPMARMYSNAVLDMGIGAR